MLSKASILENKQSSFPLNPIYKCFCNKNYMAKTLLVTHCQLRHQMTFDLDDNNIYYKSIEEDKFVLVLKIEGCRQKRCVGLYKISAEKHKPQKNTLQQTLSLKTQATIKREEQMKQMQVQLITVQEKPVIHQLVQPSQIKCQKINYVLDLYLQCVFNYDEPSFNDSKILINFLKELILLKLDKVKQSARQIYLTNQKKFKKPREFNIEQTELIPWVFNDFVSEYLPKILFQKGTQRSNILRSTKLNEKKRQINFLGSLYVWLKLNGFCSSSLLLKNTVQSLLS